MIIFSVLSLVACVEDVSKDKAHAVVEDVAADAPANERAAAAERWAVDASRSTLKALGAKVTATHPIEFGQWQGQVAVSDGQLSGVEYTIQMESLSSDHPKLTQHLKAADFFDVSTFPTASFRSTKIVPGASEPGMTHTVTGELTIRGTTKQVSFPAQLTVGADEVAARTEFAIDRKDFGIEYPGKPDDLIQDKVVLTVELVAPKPKA